MHSAIAKSSEYISADQHLDQHFKSSTLLSFSLTIVHIRFTMSGLLSKKSMAKLKDDGHGMDDEQVLLFEIVKKCAIDYDIIKEYLKNEKCKDMKEVADGIVKYFNRKGGKVAQQQVDATATGEAAQTKRRSRLSVIIPPKPQKSQKTIVDFDAVIWANKDDPMHKGADQPPREAQELVWDIWLQHSSDDYRECFGDWTHVDDFKKYYDWCWVQVPKVECYTKSYLPLVRIGGSNVSQESISLMK